jgi:hypothetical protein
MHLQAISADLGRGLNCLWLVPDDLVERGDAEELLDDLVARNNCIRPARAESGMRVDRVSSRTARPAVISTASSGQPRPAWADAGLDLVTWDEPADSAPVLAVPPEPYAPTIADRVLAECGIDVPAGQDALTVLAEAPLLHGRIIAVTAWHEQDAEAVSGLLTRLTAMTRGQPISARPRLLVAARLNDVPPALIDQLDPLYCRLRWWWGCTAPRDTAIVVALARPAEHHGPTDPVQTLRELIAADVIVEVAGPDLTFAERLAVAWDGRQETLPNAVEEVIERMGDVSPMTWRPRGRYWEHPPRRLRAAWASGAIDAWGGHVMSGLSTVPLTERDAALRQRMWRGQHRTLMPLIDDYRAMIEQDVRLNASASVLSQIAIDARQHRNSTRKLDPRVTLEIAAMAWAVNTGRVRLPPAKAALLNLLNQARNTLAHLCLLNDVEIDQLAAAMVNAAD